MISQSPSSWHKDVSVGLEAGDTRLHIYAHLYIYIYMPPLSEIVLEIL